MAGPKSRSPDNRCTLRSGCLSNSRLKKTCRNNPGDLLWAPEWPMR